MNWRHISSGQSDAEDQDEDDVGLNWGAAGKLSFASSATEVEMDWLVTDAKYKMWTASITLRINTFRAWRGAARDPNSCALCLVSLRVQVTAH